MSGGQEQRAVHRVPFVQAAVLLVDGKAVQVRLLDISLMGALVAPETAPADLAVGGACRMRLTLAPDVMMELAGEVVRATDRGGRFGIQWDSMDVDSASHLRRLLELNLGDDGLIEQDIEAMYAAHLDSAD
ncbi:MAG: PilZ domain-containing protein [Acidihalobacter sp.]